MNQRLLQILDILYCLDQICAIAQRYGLFEKYTDL